MPIGVVLLCTTGMPRARVFWRAALGYEPGFLVLADPDGNRFRGVNLSHEDQDRSAPQPGGLS